MEYTRFKELPLQAGLLKILLFGLAAMMWLGACTQRPSEEGGDSYDGDDSAISRLKGEVMKVHDRLMPQMGKMAQLREQLKKKAPETADSAGYKKTGQALVDSRAAMMDWMQNFKQPEEQNWSEKKTKNYLKEQKKEMLQIEKRTNAAIDKAKKLLNENS